MIRFVCACARAFENAVGGSRAQKINVESALKIGFIHTVVERRVGGTGPIPTTGCTVNATGLFVLTNLGTNK